MNGSGRNSRIYAVRAAIMAVSMLGTSLLAGGTALANTANLSVIARGLNNPRGLKFGPDGNLYVAEGGSGGTHSTVGQCDQVPGPIGPYTGSDTGASISMIDHDGNVTTVVNNLPSSQTQPVPHPLISGVADIAFIGNTLYAIEAGAGCSHGAPAMSPNQVYRIDQHSHSATPIANLSAFQMANPVAHPEADDFEPDGTWYSMIAVGGALYAVEPNHGEIDRITTSGHVSRVVDVSASQGHVVPTALAYHGNFFVGNLGLFGPGFKPSNVWKVTPSGQIKLDTEGFRMVVGLAFDTFDQMYVLELDSGDAFPSPNKGRVIRVHPNGAKEVVADGLNFPTGITYGPDGNLYVSNNGIGPPGSGEIVRIDLASWKH